MIAGIGSRRRVTADEVLAAVDLALAEHGVTRDALSALAILPLKEREPGIAEAAKKLNLPMCVTSPPEILVTPTRSGASLEATGQGSASEAAALTAAGPGARLLGPRTVLGAVTCALAKEIRS